MNYSISFEIFCFCIKVRLDEHNQNLQERENYHIGGTPDQTF